MLSDAIKRAFEKKLVRGWGEYPRMFVAVDLHDVIIPGTYTLNNEGRHFYDYAKEVLQELSDRKDMCLILFTSSHEESINEILKWLENNGIKFDYINENPECHNNKLCDFSKKIYMDLLLEDKAGFNGKTNYKGENDWLVIKNTFIELDEWGKRR